MRKREKTNVEVATGCETTQETAGKNAKRYNELDGNALVDAFYDDFDGRYGTVDYADYFEEDDEEYETIRVTVFANLDIWLTKDADGKWCVDTCEIDDDGYMEDVEEFLNNKQSR